MVGSILAARPGLQSDQPAEWNTGQTCRTAVEPDAAVIADGAVGGGNGAPQEQRAGRLRPGAQNAVDRRRTFWMATGWRNGQTDSQSGRAYRAGKKRQTPLNIPGSAKESQLHVTIAELLDWTLTPPAFYTTFPAGWGKLGGPMAARLKRSGLKAGMPDILVFHKCKVMGIELKIDGASPSGVQRVTFAQLQAAGCPVYVCRSIADVLNALTRCRVPFKYTEGLGNAKTKDVPFQPGAVESDNSNNQASPRS